MTRIAFDPRIAGRPVGLPSSDVIADLAVAKALEAYETAAQAARADSAELEQLKRGRTDAATEDRRQQAAALARGRDADTTTASDALEAKIAKAERRLAARRVLADQAISALEKLLTDKNDEISRRSAQRVITARRAWLRALDRLAEPLAELQRAAAGDAWLRGNGAKYVPGVATVRDRRDQAVLVADLVEQLRTLHAASSSAPEPVEPELEPAVV